MSNERWLAGIPGTRLLHRLVLPGSHDAGVYGASLTTFGAPKSLTRCQGSNIYNQALSGSRVFDCRVFLRRQHTFGNLFKKDKKVVEVVPTMGHFAAEKTINVWGRGSLGGYGGTLTTAVKDALAFVKTYTSEFVILRFSHTYAPDDVIPAIRQLTQNDQAHIYTGGGNLAQKPLSDLRGKVIMVFASEFLSHWSPKDGVQVFTKHSAGTSVASGLCACGVYKSKSDIKKVHGNAVAGLDEHKSHGDDHLLWIYWQQTGGNVQKNTVSEKKTDSKTGREKALTGGAHGNLEDFCAEIVQNVFTGRWNRPNIVGHDFVNETTCGKIIALNNQLPA